MADLATLARPYANAAFDVAKSNSQLSAWSQSLGTITLASVEPGMQTIIGSPSIDDKQKAFMLGDVCGDEVIESVKFFVQILADSKRLGILPNVFLQFEELRAQEEKSLDVEVVSAFEMSPEEEQKLKAALQTRFDRDIRMESHVDVSLMGGAIIRAGDTVIDGSVRGKMQKMAETLQRV
ncbi:MAG: F0F1 ATP synthase subunit delta [Pseudomonadales bacterium]|nr:F0F1 ATP synthase subunit delta [Pseudomonadales bacterium]